LKIQYLFITSVAASALHRVPVLFLPCSWRAVSLPLLLYTFTSEFHSTDQQLAYLRQRDLSVIYGLV